MVCRRAKNSLAQKIKIKPPAVYAGGVRLTSERSYIVASGGTTEKVLVAVYGSGNRRDGKIIPGRGCARNAQVTRGNRRITACVAADGRGCGRTVPGGERDGDAVSAGGGVGPV